MRCGQTNTLLYLVYGNRTCSSVRLSLLFVTLCSWIAVKGGSTEAVHSGLARQVSSLLTNHLARATECCGNQAAGNDALQDVLSLLNDLSRYWAFVCDIFFSMYESRWVFFFFSCFWCIKGKVTFKSLYELGLIWTWFLNSAIKCYGCSLFRWIF